MILTKKILLIGGSGVLGRQIADGLSKDFEIVIFDRNKRTPFDTIQFDILDQDTIKKEFSKHNFEAVIHLIGSPDVKSAEQDFDKAFKTNIVSLRNSIKCCKNTNTKLIFTSSAAIYGKQKIPHSENLNPEPVNTYGLLKYLCEEMLMRMCKDGNIRYTIMRIFSVYSKEDTRLLIGKMFNSLKNRETMEVYNTNQVRDFIHIDDLNQILKKIIESKESDNEIINIGSGIGHSIKEITDLFEKYSNLKLEISEGEGGYDSLSSTDKLKKLCGISPRDILLEVIERLKNELY